jgi:2-phosphoglycerate kinase
MTEPVAILIGGVPGAGKTTLAIKLANELGIKEVVDTDNIRQVMRIYDKNPILHSVTHDCWKFFGEKTDENSLKGFAAHTELLHEAIIEILRYNLRRNTSIIIEGVHVTPDLLKKIDFAVSYFHISISDEKEHLQRLQAKKCCGTCWQQNFSVIRKTQDWLISECLNRKIPVIENKSVDVVIEDIIPHVHNVNRLRLCQG